MIHFDHVTYTYGNAQAPNLRDVTLDIPAGQCVLLCGESGSGKTTVSRLINGLIPQYYEGELQGSVTVGDLNVSTAELYDTARIVGSVFQNPRSQFFCVDTTSELAFGCENMGLAEDEIHRRIDEVKQDMDLDGLMDRSIFELSGGEKQKIACASVSALHPDVFVLDEPTSNLDVQAIEELRKTISLWKSRGKTIIIAEHRLYWLKDLCDRVIFMQDGAVGFDMPMNEFRQKSDEELHSLGLRGLHLDIQDSERPVYTAERSIRLQNFKFAYDGKQALDIPELELPEGAIIAVIGSNGAGKSTFSRCLCGLEKQFKGTAQWDGKPLHRKDLLKQGYMVMQDVNHQLFCDTVEEEVQLGMEEENAPNVPQVLQHLDLQDLTSRHPMSLSGGQKQRVAIASSMLAGKRLLLFDEPTSGLDYRHMQQTGDVLQGLRGKKTTLIVTHDPELICRCCTHVLHLEQGRVAEFYPLDHAGTARLQHFFLREGENRGVYMNEENKKQKSTFSWVMSFAGQKKVHYVLSALLAICGSVCQVLPFLVIARIIQMLLGGTKDFGAYTGAMVALVVLWLLRVLFHSLSTTCSHVATFTVLGNIRKKSLLKLESMPLGDVQHRGSGDLKNILVERIDSVETTLAHMVPEMTGNITVVIGTLIYLFSIDWRMALVSLISFPIGMICFSMMMLGYEENYARTVTATKNLNDTAVEYISGIEVIKVFGKAKSSYEKFVAAAKEGAASYVDWMRKSNVYFTFAMNIMPATLVTVLPVGGWMVMRGSLEVADFVLITIMAMGLIVPILNCMSYSDDIAKLGTVLGEVTAILDGREMPRPETSKAKPKDSTITLENVHFGYEDDHEVLHGVSARFPAGTVNALVGPSGSGKSTIAKLIASFWDVSSGSVSIGGVDIRSLAADEYNQYVAYVSQENFLFDDTIRENIRMGRLDATDAEVEQAAKDCGVYDFIMSLEKGFDTVVGTGGGHLSGGEKQRISIARAMLKDAPIVILDEATAYTDPENEAIIQASVARLVQGKTLLVIAHRLSTVMDADQIVVVNHGSIEASGTHSQLLETCSLYKTLWDAHMSSKDSLTGGEANV